jgi:hypothetical protein
VAILARVTNDLDEPRGPDVLHTVEVPGEWLAEGASVEIKLPRFLPCARCDGGGCDLCGRKGALEAAAAAGSSEVVITLPRQAGAAPSAVRLRLPASGARDTSEANLPPGHLLLTVIPRDAAFGWAPAPTLRRLELPQSSSQANWADARMWAIAFVLVSLLSWWLLTRG